MPGLPSRKKSVTALLTTSEMERLRENFDVYDLVEMLNLSVNDLIDAFDYLIEENEEILDRIAG